MGILGDLKKKDPTSLKRESPWVPSTCNSIKWKKLKDTRSSLPTLKNNVGPTFHVDLFSFAKIFHFQGKLDWESAMKLAQLPSLLVGPVLN